MKTPLQQTFFLLASLTLAASAHASYGQMKFPGLALFLVFMLTVSYGVLVDIALIARLFRHRIAVAVGTMIALAVVFLLLRLAASSGERGAFFSGGSGRVLFMVTSAVFVPFIFIAPFAQYLAMRHGRPWPGWIAAWMVLQLALPPAFLVLWGTEQYFWRQEYAAGEAVGRQARAGELGTLLERADQRHERIWGTRWTYPWPQLPLSEPHGWSTGWIIGLAKGIDATALISANEPLSAPDYAALRTLMDRHFLGLAIPHIRTRLLWDTLEPGGFAGKLAPKGLDTALPEVGEEVIPVLLEWLEMYGAARLCPDGRMMDADRAVLNAVILKLGRVWNGATRDYEMRPDWVSYPQRVDRVCTGPG